MNNYKYIDIHAHLNFSVFDQDRAEVIRRSEENGVMMINVGTKFLTSQKATVLAGQYENCYAIVGLHPIHTNISFHDQEEIGHETIPFNSAGEKFDHTLYQDLISHPKVVGVGECGLDFYHVPEDVPNFKTIQIEAFESQIDFAVKNDKPIMIHCRDAYDEVLSIIKNQKKVSGEKLRGNLHFFAGTTKHIEEFLDLGFTVSFTGVITFAQVYKELVQYVPLDRTHAETDCPYVAPVPHRGQRNEPSYVTQVVKKIADIKQMPLEKVSAQLMENAKTLFQIL